MAKTGRAKAPCAMVEKAAAGLRPVGPYDAEAIDRAKLGQVFDLVPRARRSNPQNRLYWSILGAVVEATQAWPTPAHLHEKLVKGCGFVTLVLDPFTGEYTEERDSTAFDAMPPDEFKVYMDTALGRLSEVLGVDVIDLLPPQEPRR